MTGICQGQPGKQILGRQLANQVPWRCADAVLSGDLLAECGRTLIVPKLGLQTHQVNVGNLSIQTVL